ncbi:hypothetical protein HYZ97_02390 [Candidatus Pacearchaeota archaeon]|nr:hypothetical protein [Candidatus Pacearchaeota archaeon]
MPEKLAIIKGIDAGIKDTNNACIWFETYTSEHCEALQIFFEEDMLRFIKDAGCPNILSLEGEPCWVTTGGQIMKFSRLWGKDAT